MILALWDCEYWVHLTFTLFPVVNLNKFLWIIVNNLHNHWEIYHSDSIILQSKDLEWQEKQQYLWTLREIFVFYEWSYLQKAIFFTFLPYSFNHLSLLFSCFLFPHYKKSYNSFTALIIMGVNVKLFLRLVFIVKGIWYPWNYLQINPDFTSILLLSRNNF